MSYTTRKTARLQKQRDEIREMAAIEASQEHEPAPEPSAEAVERSGSYWHKGEVNPLYVPRPRGSYEQMRRDAAEMTRTLEASRIEPQSEVEEQAEASAEPAVVAPPSRERVRSYHKRLADSQFDEA